MKVVVVGGGIVGASAAYHVARLGADVTVVDRADYGQATAAGAGIIAPDASLMPNDPLGWLVRRAHSYYPHLLAQLSEDGAATTGYEVVGALIVAITEDEADHIPGLLKQLAELRTLGFHHIGDVAVLEPAEARRRFPPLGDVETALYNDGAARIDGRLLRDALNQAARRLGATMALGSAEVVIRRDRAVAITIGGQVEPADAVILATGAWSAGFAELLDVKVPVYPQKGQIIHLDMPNVITCRWPIVVAPRSYVLAFPSRRVVTGATWEDDVGYDYRVTARGVYQVLNEVMHLAPGLATATLTEVRIGFRPASPDPLPILGTVPGLTNVVLATGLGGNGLQWGPYVGCLAANLALGEDVAVDLEPFSVRRFQ